MIFAEGTTSNNTHIKKLRKGAFNALRTVRPVIVNYKTSVVQVDNAVLDDASAMLMVLSSYRCVPVEVIVCPPFTPNEHLF